MARHPGDEQAEWFFGDPLSPATRSHKRSLVIAAFVALLVSVLDLKVVYLAGFQADGGVIGNDLARGGACLILLYLLPAYAIQVCFDYTAWRRERAADFPRPCLEQAMRLEAHLGATWHHLDGALRSATLAPEAHHHMEQLQVRMQSLHDTIVPLATRWREAKAAERLPGRLRLAGFWALDVALPLVLALLGVWNSHSGLAPLFRRFVAQALGGL